MLNLSYDSFTELYYNLLRIAIDISQQSTIIDTRAGQVYELGQAYFSIDSDEFRMPLLPKRGYNPFFAFTEFAWFIKGDNSLFPLQKILSSYNQYSDDQKTLNGAYGARLRSYFNFDQIERAINELKKFPASRRVVLQLWSPNDLGKESKDIPCNTELMLKIRENKLNLTVINRSNDLYKGVPYNVFLFFMLQKYIANRLECKVGLQSHFTDNLHIYLSDFNKIKPIIEIGKNLNFIKINKLLKDFSWDSILSNQEILNFFADIPYDKVNDDFLSDKRNIFSFNKTNYNSLENFIKISNSPLMLINLLWQDKYNKITSANLLFEGFFAMKNRYYFEKFKYVDTTELNEGACRFSLSEKDKILSIKKILRQNYINEIDDNEKLLQSFFLSSVLATVDKQTTFQTDFQTIQNNIKSVCNKLKIDYNYICILLPFVDTLWEQ